MGDISLDRLKLVEGDHLQPSYNVSEKDFFNSVRLAVLIKPSVAQTVVELNRCAAL